MNTFGYGDMSIREVHYKISNTIDYAFNIFTDCTKFHIQASGYEKYKGLETDNNLVAFLGVDRAMMEGYGNYVFKPKTNLFSFIEYCYRKEQDTTTACAYKGGASEVDSWDYTKLMSYRDKAANNDFFKYFWQNMSALCSNFKAYQDEFFFMYYTYPATQKVGINLAKLKKKRQNAESVKEYLTCLTSYTFSITRESQVEDMTFGKGDVVPFLYYKDRNHANINVDDVDSLREIAKYAYVALIEGWCQLPNKSYHLWEDEYQYLYGAYNREELDYDIETLHEWYDKTYQRYYKDKGKRGNNLLGSKIEHIIESDYSIEQQLEATDYYIRQVFNELGIETDYKETMARNELMAKYMMQESRLDETIKDYNVTINFMTENLQRGTHEEQNTHTVVTSDFQVIDFDYTMDKRHIKHSDEDGINDGEELGNEKWVNITGFVRKTYEDAKSKGETHKATFEEQVEDIIDKNGAYIDINGNKVYGSVKWDETKTKVLYRVYDYNSNPKLNDTDFDGLNDNDDIKRLDNKFSGRSEGIGKVEYNQDFRWFMTTNNKYNDELAVMSVMMCNLANGNSISTDQASGDIQTYLYSIGFRDIQNIGENTDKIYVAKKTIQYYNSKQDVVGLFIGRCDRWYEDIIKYKESKKNKAITTEHRENFETYINKIINRLKNYATEDSVYWICGYDVGGSIASEVASKISGKVYCYTFGALNTRETPNAMTYIKNIRNEDDFFVKYIKGTKPGQNYGKSIYEDLMNEYRQLTDNSKYEGNYIFTNYLLKVYDETEFLNVNGSNEAERILESYFRTFNQITNQEDIQKYADLVILLNKWRQGNEQAHSIKSYYVLAKTLTGFDLLDYEAVEHYRNIPQSMLVAFTQTEEMIVETFVKYGSIIDVLLDIGKYYINTINTHEATNYSDRANDLANGENGASKYFDRTNSNGSDGLSEYKYPTLQNLSNIRDNKYLVSNSKIFGDTQNYDFNIRPYNTGDSCSDFAITAIRMLSNGYRGEPTDSYDKKAKDKVKDDYGLYLHNTYSLIMFGVVEGEEKDRRGAVGSLSFERAMSRLGYEKIYVTEGMTVADLEVGDLLVSKEHVEYYIGTNYKTEYCDMRNGSISDWKKSGIEEIYETLGTKHIDNGKLYGTFGWGGVHDEFPVESSTGKLCYFYKYDDEPYYRHCECGKEPNRIGTDHISSQCKFSDEEHQYKIIWRKQ